MLFHFNNTYKMNKQYKTYELELNENSDAIVDAIALTTRPAIESLFLAFNEVEEIPNEDIIELRFDSVDEDEMELMGAAMIPDFPMLRKANDVIKEKHYVKFTTAQIKEAQMLFMKNGYQKNLNIEHTKTNANAFVFESYIINKERGKYSPKGLDLPEGTWVITVKCEDESVFKAVKKLGAGFSVQGMFKYKFQSEVSDDDKLTKQLLSEIKTILRKIK